jgi:AraC-like DNA-binding protein
MPENITSAFSEPEDFETALRPEGFVGLLVTGRGGFRAQLTRVTLNRMRLSAAEEHLARIAFLAVPSHMVRISFLISDATVRVSGAIELQPGEILVLAPGEAVHLRTDGARCWGAISLPVQDLIRYGSVLNGSPFPVPAGAQCWRPPPAAGKRLRSLHAAAIRMAQRRPQALVDRQTAQGLEQELIHVLVECLSAGSAGESSGSRDVMIRFERWLTSDVNGKKHAAKICAMLGISERLLRSLCNEQLGMSLMSYVKLRRMWRVRNALRLGGGDGRSVKGVARQFGFNSRGRFAVSYNALFGESPSTTLRRGDNGSIVKP